MAVFGVFEGLTAAFASGAAGLTAYALARWPEVAARTGAARGPNAATVGHGGKGPAADTPVADENPDAASARAPYPIWRCDATGRVLWGNVAFRQLCADLDTEAEEGASPFGDDSFSRAGDDGSERHCILAGEGAARWFDLHRVEAGATVLVFAVPVDDVVRAEAAQRNFVQTLTKTFAQLSIGLAVFDRQRQLALFNPALVDLTRLSASFLTARPYIASFFDRLRDNRVMPEPRDYPSWRDRIASLEAAARHGDYAETWTLDSGQTYRISGRPHPDGALAFLIEDISAEVTATRQFRDQLQLAQSVLDGIDSAIAVFAPSGLLILCNRTYGKLWDLAPDEAFADVTVTEARARWTELGQPCEVWPRLHDYVLDLGERRAWSAEVAMRDGRRLRGEFSPLQGSRTLVIFCGNDATRAPGVPQRLSLAPGHA